MPLSPSAPQGPTPPPPRRQRGDACPGALRLHRADDGSLARVRVPGGLLTDRQAQALAELADRLGDGHLDITSRGNLQLRGLPEDVGGELGDRLARAGLLPSYRHERVRNVIASPLTGLDGTGRADVRDWVRRLDALLCASPAAAGLSGRFLFALDDGRGDVAALGADVTVVAGGDGTATLHVGDAGPGGPGLRVPEADAPRCAVLAAEEFLTLAAVAASETDAGTACAADGAGTAGAADGAGRTGRGASGRVAGAWRIRELPARHALTAERLRDHLARHGVTAAYGDLVPPAAGGPPTPGVVGGPDGRRALSVIAPLGRLTSAQWRLLAACAADDGAGELRVTPWRGVIVPGLSRTSAPARLAALAAAGLVTDPASPWLGVSACTGRPGCGKSLADVRADVTESLAGSATDHRAAGPVRPPVHWSGCERRCGHPGGGAPDGRWIDVLATGRGYRVTAVGAARGTAHGAAPPDEPPAGAEPTARQLTAHEPTAQEPAARELTARETATAIAAARRTI
ncbi:precorrin-3B synthase [Streptomyces sp. URMC 123]|uniref:precorrin-3B synthase n=1 Tax=Streptomyces sp. URMC 123 TaxID=3423403 RepID=UPI003F1DAABD